MNRVPTVIICAPDPYVGQAVESALTGAGARCTLYAATMDMLRHLDSADQHFDYIVVEKTGYGLTRSAMLGRLVGHLAPAAHVFLLSGSHVGAHGFDETRLTVVDLRSPTYDICRTLTDRVSNDYNPPSQTLLVA